MSAAKPAAKKASKPAAKKAATSSGPTYEAMIKEAVLAHPTEARSGIGRATIKKYIQSHHPETAKGPEASFNSRVNAAITRGAEKKVFLLPKGPSGKVKLAPKVKAEKKPTATAAVTKKAVAAKKPVAKKAAVKKPAAKKPVAKKAAAKKPAAKKTASSTAAKAKKPAAKKAAKPAAKKAAAKKA